MSKTIFHQFILPHSPEVIWDFLTVPELMELWLMSTNFKPEVGHHFEFRTKPKFKIGFDGTVYCQVLEVIPHQKLVYSWKGGLSKENPSLNSVVTWTLTPQNEKTILTLEHAGFDGFKNILPYFIMNKGWVKIGNRLNLRIKEKYHVG